MIVKFFKKRSKGKASSCKACIDYLLNKPNNTAKILLGDPRLSQYIADSLDFKNTYTAGCLSFEEADLPEKSKQDIMARFESALFAGLDPEQYNISWVQHTDKGRLELNFVIPNVELTSRKRLQPYFDKADRPLVENFKQLINLEYQLSDPNDPTKKQSMITRQELPKDKKLALLAITEGLETLATAGHIHNRQDVINALTQQGFEITRITPKNISIKTEGQNLRLKGAFYEQDFNFSETVSDSIAKRAREYQRNRPERYQTARERFNRAVTARQQTFSRQYPNRAEEIDNTYCQNVQNTYPHWIDNFTNNADSTRLFNNENKKCLSSLSEYAEMGDICQDSEKTQWLNHSPRLPNRDREPNLCGNGRGIYQQLLEKQPGTNFKNRQTTKRRLNAEETDNGNPNRNTFRENIERLIRTATERAVSFAERIREFTAGISANSARKCLDTATIQRNQQAIDKLNQFNECFTQNINHKIGAKKEVNYLKSIIMVV